MGTSRLTILGFAIIAWSGVVGLGALAWAGSSFSSPATIVALLGATGGLATAIVGAARHDVL